MSFFLFSPFTWLLLIEFLCAAWFGLNSEPPASRFPQCWDHRQLPARLAQLGLSHDGPLLLKLTRVLNTFLSFTGLCALPSSPLQSVELSFVYRLHRSSPECKFSEKTQVLNVMALQSLLLITPSGKQKVSPFSKRLPPFEDTAAE